MSTQPVARASASPDVLIIGAGMVGANAAYQCARAGLRVTVLDRGAIAGGTTSAGEGNILVSDKAPGPELELALHSVRLWRETADAIGADAIEYDPKGGLVVAAAGPTFDALTAFAATQRAAGVEAEVIPSDRLRDLEPNIGAGLAGGVHYPQDSQVQPMAGAAHLLRAARALGAEVLTATSVTGFLRDGDRVIGVTTDSPTRPVIHAGTLVNAAGTWSAEVADLAGAPIPVMPRRGFLLVTEPLPRAIRMKVYTAEYVANVESSEAALQTSVVVEGTRSGTVLIGASRERVGFDRTFSLEVVRRLSAGAIAVFPFLAGVSLMRTYLGFRPYCPDHLPIIGPDPRAPGLVHASGHEGAGICLAPATGLLIAQIAAGAAPLVDLTPFRPERFA